MHTNFSQRLWHLAGLCALVAMLSAAPARAADEAMASALATSAEKLHAQDQHEKAKALCYKALVYDRHCPEALYLLARIFEAEGQQTAAGNFYVQALRELEKKVATKPDLSGTVAKARVKVRELNPHANDLKVAMQEYARTLTTIARRSPDSLTLAQVRHTAVRVDVAHFMDDGKLPADLANIHTADTAPPAKRDDHGAHSETKQKPTATALAPEIERELKGYGWETITGTWKKLGTGRYEVTDGRLEASKINGAITVTVHRGGSGEVTAFVRNDKSEESGKRNPRYVGYTSNSTASGYGVTVKGTTLKVYSPSDTYLMGGSRYTPWLAHTKNLSSSRFTKDVVLIKVTGNNLEILVNNVKEKKTTYKIDETGTFLVKVKGTKIIELPKNMGQ